MHLAGAGDDHLLGLGIKAQLHSRVFFAQPLQSVGHLLLIALGLAGDGKRDGGGRELLRREAHHTCPVAQRIPRGCVLEFGQRHDIPCGGLVNALGLLALHGQDVAGTLAFAGADVQHLRIAADAPRENSGQVDAP